MLGERAGSIHGAAAERQTGRCMTSTVAPAAMAPCSWSSLAVGGGKLRSGCSGGMSWAFRQDRERGRGRRASDEGGDGRGVGGRE